MLLILHFELVFINQTVDDEIIFAVKYTVRVNIPLTVLIFL